MIQGGTEREGEEKSIMNTAGTHGTGRGSHTHPAERTRNEIVMTDRPLIVEVVMRGMSLPLNDLVLRRKIKMIVHPSCGLAAPRETDLLYI